MNNAKDAWKDVFLCYSKKEMARFLKKAKTKKVLDHGIEGLEGKKLALLLPFYVLKYRREVKVARSEEERRALVSEVEGMMGRLLDAVRRLREQGMLTDRDEELMLGAIEVLYTKLYEPYEGFREAKTMVDERIMTRFDKLRMEIAEAKAEVVETKAEVARNLLKAGVSKDIILQATGLTLADIENQSNIVSSPASAPR